MKCSALNSASDDDKAYAATYLLGYHSGLLRSHTLDTKMIDAVETAAMAECASHPDATATKVFAATQLKVEASMTPPPHHRLHRKPAPVTPAAASPEPSESPPMRYAPAQETPAPETPVEPSSPAPAENPPATPPPGESPRQ